MHRACLVLTLLLAVPLAAAAEEALEEAPPPRTWGIAGLDLVPAGHKMAPNGLGYDPLFTAGLLLNVAVTPGREVYVFAKTRFWAQQSEAGVTNANQGRFDFSKRQIDLDAGTAWNFWGPLEARAYLYSDNNLNRGWWLDKPTGFQDGFGVECRCWLPGTDFDRGLYRYVALGYYPTKTQVGGDGREFSPGFYAAASLAWDVEPGRLYGYLEGEYVSRDGFVPKLLVLDPGVAWRPWERYDAFELRLGVESTVDVEVGYTRAFVYGSVRVVW
jgi:hypothetical protein